MNKKLLAIISAVALTLTLCVGTVSAAVRTVTLRVRGMTCGGCATSVEKALKATDGVEQARVSFERGRAVIKYDDQKITVAKLREIIQSTGFFCDAEGSGRK